MVARRFLAGVLALSVVLASGVMVPVTAADGAESIPVSATEGADSTGPVAGPAASQPDNATVQVQAAAELSAPPDLATVRLAVVATADTPDAARRMVAEDATRMRDALRKIGVDDDQVRSTYYELTPVYDARGEQREPIGYRVAHGFAVEVTADAAELGNRTGAVLDVAVGNGAAQVDSVEFGLTEETRRDLRVRALRQAMANARADAAVVAGAGNLTITGVRSVATVDVDVNPTGAALRESADEGGGTVIEPGRIVVAATVSVTYHAE